MNETGNPEKTNRNPFKHSAFKSAVRFFTFINFFLALILISDFFMEPGYEKVEESADSSKEKTFSLRIGGDSLKIHNGSSEVKENEMAAFTPIFNIDVYHKYKTGKEDSYSVDLENVALPFVAVIIWIISFAATLKYKKKKGAAEPALMYQALLLPIIVSFVYWIKLYNYLAG